MNDFVIIVTGLKSLVLDINVTIHCAGEVAFIIYIRTAASKGVLIVMSSLFLNIFR